MCGKDPHKVDRVGALRARQGAGVGEATVWLSWLPGLEAPDSLSASVDGEWWDENRILRAVSVPDLSIDEHSEISSFTTLGGKASCGRVPSAEPGNGER